MKVTFLPDHIVREVESGTTITATPTFTSVATGVVAERTDVVDGVTSYTYTAPATDAE